MYFIRFKLPYNQWKVGDEVEPFAKVYYFYSTNTIFLVRLNGETIIVPSSKVDLIDVHTK